MKKTIFKLSFAILFAIVSLFAAKTAYSQVPDAINFQAIARDASGEVLANTEIMLQLTILDGSAEGTEVYREVRTLTTNNYGSFSFQIGRDVTEFEGDFSAIDWSADDKFIKIDYDPTASSNFELSLGTIEFVTVPYAFTARDVIYIDATNAATGDVLVFDEETGKFKPGQVSAGSVTWDNIDGKPDFAEVATTGNYGDLEGAPELATVATSGDYGDLINPPELFSGNYGDLQGAPVLNIDNWNTAYSWNNHAGLYRPIDWVPAWGDINEKPDFAEVATSGDYNHLINTPTDLSDFTNNAGYLKTESQNLSDVLNNGTDAGNKNITNLANPTGDQHAATKFYVDDKVNTLGEEVDALENTVSGLSDNVSNLTTTVDGLTNDLTGLTTTVTDLTEDVNDLTTDVADLTTNVDALDAMVQNNMFFKDTRDNRSYKVVKIGEQIWMAENLKYLPNVVGHGTGSGTVPYCYVYGYNGTDVEVAKTKIGYTTYGVLYNWTAAMAEAGSSEANPSGVQGICPDGWHLPSDAEWVQLINYLGGAAIAGGKLKEVDTTHWKAYNIGATNESGFTALPGGFRHANGDGFFGSKAQGHFWSATEDTANNNNACKIHVVYHSANVYKGGEIKAYGYSVRCVKNTSSVDDLALFDSNWDDLYNTPTTLDGYGITDANLAGVLAQGNSANSQQIIDLADPTEAQHAATKAYVDALETTVTTLLAMVQELEISNGFFTDTRDNNRYNVVKIGDQIWMAENLAYKPSSGNYWAYNNDDSYIATYGYLYDWNAAMNGAESSNSTPSSVQGICPAGWHLPSDEEWTILTDYLGGNTGNAGGKLKEAGDDHWQSPNTGANNESGFTALPGGYYNYGDFDSIGYYGYWWSATEYDTSNAWLRSLSFDYSLVNRLFDTKSLGFSVRCVKNN